MALFFNIFHYLFLIPLSYMPDRILYFVSDLCYFFVSKIVLYRRSTIDKNLLQAFPHFPPKKRNKIREHFYHHLCDLMVESVKCFSISRQEAIAKCELTNPEILTPVWQKGQDVVIISGHYGNWELTTLGVTPQLPFQLITQYKPLKNKHINDVMVKSRTRYGLKLTEHRKPWLTHNGTQPHGHVFLADQSAMKSKHVYWVDFLNREAAVASRPEWISRTQKAAVFFIAMEKKSRGFYRLTLTKITDHAHLVPEGQISRTYTKMLEELIQKEPSLWLWSHNRWKRKRKLKT